MSNLLENKQMIHIASEIVALIGITFYFSSKNKRLLKHIEHLSQRLEDQEDMLQKHEQVIQQLVHIINTKVVNQSSTNRKEPVKNTRKVKSPPLNINLDSSSEEEEEENHQDIFQTSNVK